MPLIVVPGSTHLVRAEHGYKILRDTREPYSYSPATTGDVLDLTEDEAKSLVADFEALQGKPELVPAPRLVPSSVLRQDGPTLEQWVASGYAASAYPPVGFAVRPSVPVV